MIESSNVEVFETPARLIKATAERFILAANTAVQSWGRFTVALSGGNTPRALYELLASEQNASRVNWANVHVFWGDERCVAPDDTASNYRMARESLLDRVKIPASNIHRMRGEDDPAAAAAAYETVVREAFGTATGPSRGTPGTRFDLVLLGLGADGHTASLFPHMQALREQTHWAMAERIASVEMWRLTLTPAILNEAGEVVFLVAGSEKAAILRRVLYGERNPDELPAQAIEPGSGRLHWMLDAAAAAELHAH